MIDDRIGKHNCNSNKQKQSNERWKAGKESAVLIELERLLHVRGAAVTGKSLIAKRWSSSRFHEERQTVDESQTAAGGDILGQIEARGHVSQITRILDNLEP